MIKVYSTKRKYIDDEAVIAGPSTVVVSDSDDDHSSNESGVEEDGDDHNVNSADESESEESSDGGDEEDDEEDNGSICSSGSSNEGSSGEEPELDGEIEKEDVRKGEGSKHTSQISEEMENKIKLSLPDEYEYDSSDEEDVRNTVGNVPMEWYKDFLHIGYDLLGKKIGKPVHGDKLDELIEKNDNPDYWRTVTDKLTGERRVLSDHDVDFIQNFMKKKYAEPSYDPYEQWVDFFTHEKMIHPVTNHPDDKRSFIPSKLEAQKVGQIVHAIKMGWMKMSTDEKEEDETPKFHDIWKDDDQQEANRRLRYHIPAPKRDLPSHAESYNPPPEYLLTTEELAKWNETEPEDRRMKFIPQKYANLRSVPAYPRFVNEQFERCLDLYLCPRQRRMRVNVNAEDLIPKLPKPKDLQPFPTTEHLLFRGHTGPVRCISIHPSGSWIASGSEDCNIKVWDTLTGRCMATYKQTEPIKDIAWNPNPALYIIAAAFGKTVLMIAPQFVQKHCMTNTDNLFSSFQQDTALDDAPTPGNLTSIQWQSVVDSQELADGLRLRIKHPENVDQIVWRSHGDYFSTVNKTGNSMSVLIHHVTKRKSQNPFKKPKGLVQCVMFHPKRPFFFVATMKCIRVYNLLKQELVKKLQTNCKWVSSMAIHPEGDNLIIGSYDKKLSWFDTELSNKPYQTLKHQKKAIRQVCFHRRYPLFAAASDDGTVLIYHGKVFDDLLQNPLIVPVKSLKGHSIVQDLGVLDCEFHPTLPYIFSAGADCTIRLFTYV